MIDFKHVVVDNWETAIRGMRNSWESWDKSDSGWDWDYDPQFPHYKVGDEDLKLMMKLVRAGQDHAKFLRMINVSVDIIAPEYWWKEYDTYKVGTVANSTSMMHTLGKDYTPAEAFSFDDVDEDLKIAYMAVLNEAQKRWYESGKKKPSKEWRQMLQLTSQAFIYTRTCTLNYGVLRNMYHSRKSHRLQEWRNFATWVESLPHSQLIIEKGY